jgi:hypothetical protein
MPAYPRDISGQRFGRLVVLDYTKPTGWRCRCDCGNQTVVKTDKLNSGHTRSCGCLHSDTTRERSTIHGHSRRKQKTKAYIVWQNMMQRCYDPGQTKYNIYGGRGIRVCEPWHDFASFLADMGEPAPGLTLDRIDPDGNYEPGNCRWLDQKGQQNNRRSNHKITLGTETLSITEWSRRTGIDRHTILRRLRDGWPPDRVLAA